MNLESGEVLIEAEHGSMPMAAADDDESLEATPQNDVKYVANVWITGSSLASDVAKSAYTTG